MAKQQETGGHRNFNARFKTYLARNLTYIYRLVTTTEDALTEELREQVMHTLSYGLELETNWPMARDLLLTAAPDMELAGLRENWLPFLRQGITQGLHLNDLTAVAECRLQIGMLYRMLGDFELARQVLLESIEGFATLQAERNQARALNELAWLEQLQHNFSEAISYVEQATALLTEDDSEVAVCLRVRGMIAIGHQQWTEAEALHRDALRRFAANGDERRCAWSIQNVGYALHGQGRYEEAIHLYQQAASLLARLHDDYHWSFVQSNLGIAYYALGEAESAIEYYEKALQITENVNDKLQMGRLHTNLGLAYLSLKNYTKAKQSFQLSSSIHSALGPISLAVNAQDGLAMAHLALKEYTEALAVIEDALVTLPQIQSSPLHDQLKASLQEHLQQALAQQEQDPTDDSTIFF